MRVHELPPRLVGCQRRTQHPRDGEHQRGLPPGLRDASQQALHPSIPRHTPCPVGVERGASRGLLQRETRVSLGDSIRHVSILGGRRPTAPTTRGEWRGLALKGRVAPMDYSVQKTEEQWREEPGPEQYAVLRQAATERAWTGELLDASRAGLYTCGACGAELFKSGTKFDSGCGWPSFYESIRPDAVELIEDKSLGMVR